MEEEHGELEIKWLLRILKLCFFGVAFFIVFHIVEWSVNYVPPAMKTGVSCGEK